MFTGLVTDIGTVRKVVQRGDRRFVIATSYPVEEVAIGASIACAGVCLTVVERGRDADATGWFAADVSTETLSKTTADGWSVGTRLNLERALRVGDELGGHIVTGHIDGVANLVSAAPEGDSRRLKFEVSDRVSRFVAPKGSVALDGVSLTVNDVAGSTFAVNVIPHTQAMTTLGDIGPGDRVNVEIDVLARYVARLTEAA